jgi:hypothetical protein
MVPTIHTERACERLLGIYLGAKTTIDVEVCSTIIETTNAVMHVCEVLRHVRTHGKTDKTAWADSPQTISILSSAFLLI